MVGMWIQRGGFHLRMVVNITSMLLAIQNPVTIPVLGEVPIMKSSWRLRSVFRYENQRGSRHFFTLLEARSMWPWLSHMLIINSMKFLNLRGLAKWCSNLQQTIILTIYPAGAVRSIQWHDINGCALLALLETWPGLYSLFLAFFVFLIS